MSAYVAEHFSPSSQKYNAIARSLENHDHCLFI